MKKTLLLIGFSFMSSFAAWTQVSAGPKFGLNFSTVKGGTKDYANKMIIGYHLGAYINYEISGTFSLEPEVLYSKKGFKSNILAMTEDTNLKHTLSYIDFPLLICIRIADNASANFGPQIGYIINAHSKGVISSKDIQPRG